MNGLDIRHYHLIGKIRLVHIGHNSLLDARGNVVVFGSVRLDSTVLVVAYFIERGNVDTLNASRRLVKIRLLGIASLLLHLDVESAKLGKHLLTLSDIEEVKEICHGLGVISARAATDDYRHAVVSVTGAQRQSRKVEHIEHVGVAHLVLKRNAYHIKGSKRISALAGGQRNTVLLHLLLHIHPRCVNTLAPNVVLLVENAVKYADAEVGHSYFVSIGKAKRKSCLYLFLILDYLSVFAARISSGL